MTTDESQRSGRSLGPPSGYICPDCGGALFTVDDGELLRFRCRVGHAWTAEAVLREQSTSIEGALWVALRTLEERADLSRRLGERARTEGRALTGASFAAAATETLRSAEMIKRLLEAGVTGFETAGGTVADEAVGDRFARSRHTGAGRLPLGGGPRAVPDPAESAGISDSAS